MKKRTLLKPIFMLNDIAILTVSFQLAYWIRFRLSFLPDRPEPSFELYSQFSYLVAIIGFVMLEASGMYQVKRLTFGISDFMKILRAITVSSVIVAAVSFLLRGYITDYEGENFSRLIILLAWIISIVSVTAVRLVFSYVFREFRKRGRGLKNVIIVGTDRTAMGFFKAVVNNPEFEYRPLGMISDSTISDTQNIDGIKVIGAISDLGEIIRRQSVDEVILTSQQVDNETMAGLIKTCQRWDVQFSMIPGFFEILTQQMSVEEVADLPVFRLEERIFNKWGKLAKRGMDLSLAIVLILLFAPLLAIMALGIKFTSKGPIIFKHDRVGKGGRIFQVYKLRSMYFEDNEKRTRRDADQSQVTIIGKFIRRFSIDEIPQLINVVKGEMSLVGPRPHVVSEVAEYEHWHRRRFDVLPGITGLTQVSGRKDLNLNEMVRLDVYYIENWSPLLDFRILLRTVPAVLVGRGAY